jgi:hypothetical protein
MNYYALFSADYFVMVVVVVSVNILRTGGECCVCQDLLDTRRGESSNEWKD